MSKTITDANIELHVHPFLGKNTIAEVVNAMNQTNLDIVALEVLDDSIHQQILEEANKHYPNLKSDEEGIKLPNGKYLLNAREYNTKEGFHLLTVGYSFDDANPNTEMRKVIDEGLNHSALVLLDHPFVDNGKTRTAGHISAEMEQDLENLCKEYSGQVVLEWNGYCIPWMRKELKGVLNLIGQRTSYYDVNKKAEQLSEKLKKQSYVVPIVADTDLHARGKKQLSAMGTSRFITNVEGDSAKDIVNSMNRNIFDGNYENVKNYVSSFHLLEAFCFPVLFPKYFKKPRA